MLVAKVQLYQALASMVNNWDWVRLAVVNAYI